MTTLTEALERIMNWLNEHRPEYAASFLPGLKYDEIQAAEAELGFKLPEEIYELYQWRNGTEQEDIRVVCFPTMQFLPLSTAIEYSQEWNEYISEEKFTVEEIEQYETDPLFRFLQANCDSCGIPLINHQTEKPPVVVFGEGDMPFIWYASLTDMMLILAEFYETGAYYLDEEGFTTVDECKSAVVLRKYNNGLNQRALSAFQSILLQSLDFSTPDYSRSLVKPVMEATIDISRFKDPRGVDLLLDALQVWSQVRGKSKDAACGWVIKALGEMCDARALQPLTNALQDDSSFVREEAQAALLRLREMLQKINTQYEVKVKFEVEDGTYDELKKISATHESAWELHPELPHFEKGMTRPQIKLEKNEVESILLGESPNGVRIFNDNIIEIHRLNNAE